VEHIRRPVTFYIILLALAVLGSSHGGALLGASVTLLTAQVPGPDSSQRACRTAPWKNTLPLLLSWFCTDKCQLCCHVHSMSSGKDTAEAGGEQVDDQSHNSTLSPGQVVDEAASHAKHNYLVASPAHLTPCLGRTLSMLSESGDFC
jgi:hypothetical protein